MVFGKVRKNYRLCNCLLNHVPVSNVSADMPANMAAPLVARVKAYTLQVPPHHAPCQIMPATMPVT